MTSEVGAVCCSPQKYEKRQHETGLITPDALTAVELVRSMQKHCMGQYIV